MVHVHVHLNKSDYFNTETRLRDRTLFEVSKLNNRLNRLVWVYTCQNTTSLEITCRVTYNNVWMLITEQKNADSLPMTLYLDKHERLYCTKETNKYNQGFCWGIILSLGYHYSFIGIPLMSFKLCYIGVAVSNTFLRACKWNYSKKSTCFIEQFIPVQA